MDDLIPLATELVRYINVNRLRNVLSKEGNSIQSNKMKGRIIGLLAKDAYHDFVKDMGLEWNKEYLKVEKDSDVAARKKALMGILNGQSAVLLDTNFEAILKGEF